MAREAGTGVYCVKDSWVARVTKVMRLLMAVYGGWEGWPGKKVAMTGKC